MKVCPNCSGNGNGWPKYPTLCGGVPCPVCEGVCEVCLGEEWVPTDEQKRRWIESCERVG